MSLLAKQNCWRNMATFAEKTSQLFVFHLSYCSRAQKHLSNPAIWEICAKRRTGICFQLQMRRRCLCTSANIVVVLLGAPGSRDLGFRGWRRGDKNLHHLWIVEIPSTSWAGSSSAGFSSGGAGAFSTGTGSTVADIHGWPDGSAAKVVEKNKMKINWGKCKRFVDGSNRNNNGTPVHDSDHVWVQQFWSLRVRI